MQNISETGLSPQQVEQSRKQYGANEMTRKQAKGFWRRFLESFGDPIIKILLIALAVNILFTIRHFNPYENIGIILAILLATLISTLSEYGSSEAFEKLQEEASRTKCRVKRAGKTAEIFSSELVVGDLVLLNAGDKLPADGVLLYGELSVDQSALNGESKEAVKKPGRAAACGSDLSLPCGVFCGSVVCGGEGVMRVSAVGDQTVYGHIAGEVQQEQRDSPLKLRLTQLSKTISRFGYCAAALVAVAYMANYLLVDTGFDTVKMAALFQHPGAIVTQLLAALTLGVSVIVMAVPEGLPMMITVVLSSNMKRMLKDNVLVRKLVGIETSGSINILVCDKTGTLTQGKLSATHFVAGNGRVYRSGAELRDAPGLRDLLSLSLTENNAASITIKGRSKKAVGSNATDRCLLEYAQTIKGAKYNVSQTYVIPFHSASKFSAVGIGGDMSLSLIKGAPEAILARCTGYYDERGQKKPFSPSSVHEILRGLQMNAVRLIALAASEQSIRPGSPFPDLTLVGVVGIRDDVRREALPGIRQLQGAGVQVVMCTGDAEYTAEAIARELKMLRGRPGEVITSRQLREMSDEQVKQLLPNLRVVARALPTDKSRLVRLSQELGLVTGMTGDGVNDAPALKLADVGFAMGSGTEVAKEAGDIIILDDNLKSICRAILYGRTIFKSIRKFIIFQTTVNITAVFVSVVGPLVGVDTPVTVVQILWINMVMDTLAGLAFGAEPPMPEYMAEPPKKRDEKIMNRYMWGEILWNGAFTAALSLLFLKAPFIASLFRQSADDRYLMTAFFSFFLFAGIFNSLLARTHRVNLFSHIFKNRLFILVMGMVAVIQVCIIYFGGTLFRTAGLTGSELLITVLLALLVIPADMLRRFLLRLRGDRSGT